MFLVCSQRKRRGQTFCQFSFIELYRNMVVIRKRRRKNFFSRLGRTKLKIENKINLFIAKIPYAPLMVTTSLSIIYRLSMDFSSFTIMILTMWIILLGAVFVKTQKFWNDTTTKMISQYGIYPVLLLAFVVALVMESWVAPAHAAFFFESAEEWVKNNFTAGQGEALNTAISLIFNTLRLIFLVYIGASIIKVVGAARGDDDWKEMAKQPAIVFLAVAVGNSLTELVIGTPSQ